MKTFGLFHKATGSPRKSVCSCKRFCFSNPLMVFSATHCPAWTRKNWPVKQKPRLAVAAATIVSVVTLVCSLQTKYATISTGISAFKLQYEFNGDFCKTPAWANNMQHIQQRIPRVPMYASNKSCSTKNTLLQQKRRQSLLYKFPFYLHKIQNTSQNCI